MSTRTKLGLGFKQYFGEDEVFDLSIPSTLDPEPIEKSDKSSDSEAYVSCDSSPETKTKDFPTTIDVKTVPESDIEDPKSTIVSPSFSCLENVKTPRIFCNKSGMNNRNVCKNNYVRVKKCFVCGSKLHLIKDCNFYNCVDSVPCKSKAASVSTGSRNSSASVNAGRSDSAASRNRTVVNSASRPNPAGRIGKAAHHSADQPYPVGWDDEGDPRVDNDLGIVNSGSSRSMTGNKEMLDDFVQVKGGIVKFRGGDGRISRRGTIRTSKFDFENVYYVEELQHFNLFFVSQICDKKNRVLFTDTDCLVLTEEFSLPDESQMAQKDGSCELQNNQQVSKRRMVSAGRSMFSLVVIIPAGCFVPAGSYGLCWWLRVPAGRHTSAGGFISTGGCVFLLFSPFLLIVVYAVKASVQTAELYDTAAWSVSTGRFLLVVTQFLLVVSNHAEDSVD
nr:ribonuclease H-like domain-containing protein [Tanacetum cinerariifolium]